MGLHTANKLDKYNLEFIHMLLKEDFKVSEHECISKSAMRFKQCFLYYKSTDTQI